MRPRRFGLNVSLLLLALTPDEVINHPLVHAALVQVTDVREVACLL